MQNYYFFCKNSYLCENFHRTMTPLARLLLSITLVITAVAAQPAARYATIHNDFAAIRAGLALQPHQTARIDGPHLVLDNGQATPLLALDTTRLAAAPYRFVARLANEHNKPGKSYRAIAAGGQEVKVSPTACGVVVEHIGPATYWAVTMTCHNSNLHDDIMDRRSMVITATHYENGEQVEQFTHTMTDSVDLADGFNSLMVEVSENTMLIAVGNKEFTPVMNIAVRRPSEPVRAGIIVGPAACVAVERTVMAQMSDPHRRITTRWTQETLDAHFAASTDPLEGYWQYLDRDMDDNILRLGGRYVVALVQAGDGYDIIYVNGAQVKRQQWTTGLWKGHLKKTAFIDNYTATWVDATFLPITDDVYATFDNAVILTLRFPVFRSQLRLAKVVDF